MKTGWSLLLIALLLHMHAPAVRTQTPVTPAGVEKERVELERKTLGLVREALAEAQSLKLLENRIRAQMIAARLLWPRDAKAARAAFKAAADGVAELNAAVDPEGARFYLSAQTVAQLRAELVNAASPFDANLALEFLRATRPTYLEALVAGGYSLPWQDQSLEMGIVANIAVQEPQRALELAEESLRKGVTNSLLGVMVRLRTKEPALASKLAGGIVRRLRPEDLWGSGEAGSVAQQLLTLTQPAENSQAQGGASLLDEQTRRELIEKVLSALASGTWDQDGNHALYYSFKALLPELEKTDPARVASLRVKVEEIDRSLNPYPQQMRPYRDVMERGTGEAVLEAARKAPAEVRDQLYTHAAWKVYSEGDAERAQQILENISDPLHGARARREMEQRGHWRSVQEGSYAEARQAIALLRTPEERVQALLQVAGRVAAEGRAATARQVLDEARALIETQTRGQQQFMYRLQVAAAYSQFDAEASFAMAEAAVGRLDALLEAAETLDAFGQESFEEGELKPQSYMWSELINQCSQSVAPLARKDFERAAVVAKRFRRPEARTTMLLTLAQSLLQMINNEEKEINLRMQERGRNRIGFN